MAISTLKNLFTKSQSFKTKDPQKLCVNDFPTYGMPLQHSMNVGHKNLDQLIMVNILMLNCMHFIG